MADTTTPAQTVECSSACTVQVVIQPMRATGEDYQAAIELWGVLLGAAAVIYGARRVLEFFTERPEA